MRFWFYFLALLLYIVSVIIDSEGIDAGGRFSDLWYFAILAVCFDFTYRLRGTLYMILPLYKAIYILYLFLELPYPQVLLFPDGMVHVLTGVLFIYSGNRIRNYHNNTGWLIILAGITWFVISLRVIFYLLGIHMPGAGIGFNLPFYILAALIGKVLASPYHFSYLTEKEFEFFSFALFFSLVVVFRVFIENLYNNWHVFGF